MRTPVLVLFALAGLGLTGCGSGTTHHDAAGAPASTPGGSGGAPLPTIAAQDQGAPATCSTVTYRMTAAGVRIDARVAATPAKLNFEADDADDNPVTGDPRTSGVDHVFAGSATRQTLTIKGVRSLDHLTVIVLGTSQDDSCRARKA